jgi:lysophospholipase L1-like esterase
MKSGMLPNVRVLLSVTALVAPIHAQVSFLPVGDSITAGALAGPNSPDHFRGGYRYFLERFLEGSEGGAAAFDTKGSVTNQAGTLASFAGQWFNTPKPLKNPLHSGYPGYSIEQIDSLVDDGTIPVADGDVILLQIGTNNIGTAAIEPLAATPAEISAWHAAYQSLLDRILSKSATAKVIMAKIPPFTDGATLGRIAANATRIEPFNQQVVQSLFNTYQAAHPGRFFLVDNYSPLDPLNVEADFQSATNKTDFMTVFGNDGVHPYNAGHRKMAANFWKAYQLSKGAVASDLITPLDGAGDDACIRQSGTTPNGRVVERQPFVRSSSNPAERGKYYIKLDLSGKPKTWEDARFNLVFWGAPAAEPDFGNCVNDAPATTTLKLYGIPDGADDWNDTDITWTNAPGNDPNGNSVTGTYLGDLIVPAGTQTGDVISVTSTALRDFVNHQRGPDGLLTFAVTGDGPDPGFFTSFQDSDFIDYVPGFLQLTLTNPVRFLPVGDSITAGAFGGPNSQEYLRGGYRYFLERFLEGSPHGAAGFETNGSVNSQAGTLASFAGQWFNTPKPLKQPFHSGYPGYSIEQIDSLVDDGTIPVADSDVILLQIGTNNIGTAAIEPLAATPAEITAWHAAYQSLLDRVLAKSATAKVIMAKIPPFTDGATLGRIAANATRIEPFNQQVVQPLFDTYQAAHPGRFFLVDNYSPLDPLNVEAEFESATNKTDFMTVFGNDGVHPYNAGHRKMAANFWRAYQLSTGAAAADLITPLDGAGDDACIRQSGTTPNGRVVERQPFVRSSTNPAERGKYFIKLDLSGTPKTWEDARFNLVFWGAPAAEPDFGNCVNDAPATTTLKLYGIPDGADDWNGTDITWANAPGNDLNGNSVTGIFLGDLIVPAGTQTGDVISLTSTALRDFVNHQRGLDGLLTFAVTGDGSDPGFFASFQDSDLLDYAPGFLQLTRSTPLVPTPDLRIVSFDFDFTANPHPLVEVTFSSESSRSYLLSGSADLKTFDLVLASGIEGAAGASTTTVSAPLPAGAAGRFFVRIEQE